jgi:hypothetical protein
MTYGRVCLAIRTQDEASAAVSYKAELVRGE